MPIPAASDLRGTTTTGGGQRRRRGCFPRDAGVVSFPAVNAYSLADAARILRLSPARLRYWERTALIQPSLSVDSRAAFGFRDLVCIKAILALLAHGVPLRRIRGSVAALRERIPDLDSPVGALRVWVEGSDRVVIRHEGTLLEPDGQLVIDFSLSLSGSEEVAPLGEALRLAPERVRLETALEWFERGCRLDADAGTYDAALEAYRRALEADPLFADAHCNLATVYYSQGRRAEARTSFERAIDLDPKHVEAHFNLANLLEEDGHKESALSHYKAVLASDPLYVDAHLNLALLYDKLELRRRARAHWRRYLRLEPGGAWAELARRRLEDRGEA